MLEGRPEQAARGHSPRQLMETPMDVVDALLGKELCLFHGACVSRCACALASNLHPGPHTRLKDGQNLRSRTPLAIAAPSNRRHLACLRAEEEKPQSRPVVRPGLRLACELGQTARALTADYAHVEARQCPSVSSPLRSGDSRVHFPCRGSVHPRDQLCLS